MSLEQALADGNAALSLDELEAAFAATEETVDEETFSADEEEIRGQQQRAPSRQEETTSEEEDVDGDNVAEEEVEGGEGDTGEVTEEEEGDESEEGGKSEGKREVEAKEKEEKEGGLEEGPSLQGPTTGIAEKIKQAEEQIAQTLQQARANDPRQYFTAEELYWMNNMGALDAQIRELTSEDPARATELLAFKTTLIDKINKYGQVAQQAKQTVSSAIRQAMVEVLPSKERAQDLDRFLLETGKGFFDEKELPLITYALGEALAEKGLPPLAHKFMAFLNAVYERVNAGKNIEAIKAEVKKKVEEKKQRRVSPPKTIGAGTRQTKTKAGAGNNVAALAAKIRREGGASPEEWDAFFLGLEDE